MLLRELRSVEKVSDVQDVRNRTIVCDKEFAEFKRLAVLLSDENRAAAPTDHKPLAHDITPVRML